MPRGAARLCLLGDGARTLDLACQDRENGTVDAVRTKELLREAAAPRRAQRLASKHGGHLVAMIGQAASDRRQAAIRLHQVVEVHRPDLTLVETGDDERV